MVFAQLFGHVRHGGNGEPAGLDGVIGARNPWQRRLPTLEREVMGVGDGAAALASLRVIEHRHGAQDRSKLGVGAGDSSFFRKLAQRRRQ